MWHTVGMHPINSELVLAAEREKHAEIEAEKQRKRNEEELAMKALTGQVQGIQAARGGKRDIDLKAGELALIVKWVHLKRGMKGWSRISEHQARVDFLASIQGGWENLLPAPPAQQAMAQPQTGHATRQQSAIQGAQAAAESAQDTQPARSRKRKRPAADSRSEKNDDDAEFLKGKTDAEKRALLKRLMDDLHSQ